MFRDICNEVLIKSGTNVIKRDRHGTSNSWNKIHDVTWQYCTQDETDRYQATVANFSSWIV